MKQLNRILSIFLSVTLLMGLMPLAAQATEPQSPPPALAAPNEGAPQSPDPVKTIDGIAVTAEPKVYDGLTDNGQVSLVFSGVEPQPAPEDYTVTAVYLSPAVTRDETPNLTVTVTLTEAGLKKYQLSQEAAEPQTVYGAVTPAQATVTALNQSLSKGQKPVLDKSQAQVTLSTGETPVLESLVLTEQDGRLIPSQAVLKIWAGTAETTENYTVSYVEGSVTYQTASVSSAPAAAGKLVYNGQPQTLVTAGQAQNGEMEYYVQKKGTADAPQWSAQLPQATDAGTYLVHYRARGQEGFENSKESTVEVTVGQLPVAITAKTGKVYDGTTAVMKNSSGYDDLTHISFVSGSFLESDVKLLGVKGSSFKSGQAGENLPLIPGTVHLSGSGENYLVTVEITGTIEKKPVTVTLGGQKAYGQKDPQVLYTAEGLLKGDSLQGSVTRKAGEDAGEYELDGSLLHHGSYAITLKPGKLKIVPARTALGIKLSSGTLAPGKTVTVTVQLKNGGTDLMDSGWNQPQNPVLTLGKQTLKLTADKKDPTFYTAEYKVPEDAKTSLTFKVSFQDEKGNYEKAGAEATLKLRDSGTNPQTGDQRNPALYLALAAGSAAALVLVAVFTFRSKKKH